MRSIFLIKQFFVNLSKDWNLYTNLLASGFQDREIGTYRNFNIWTVNTVYENNEREVKYCDEKKNIYLTKLYKLQ